MPRNRNMLPPFISPLMMVIVAGTISLTSTVTFARVEERPNVVLIYTDDQGTLDLGCYGAKDLHTPNLDRLASEGIRFSQMYAPSAICSASRAGLMTGRFPARAGVPGNVSSMQGVAGMSTDEVTIAEVLKRAGYATCHVGKWHLGYTPGTMPNGQGFDRSFGHMGGCIDNYSHFFYWNGPNRHDLWRDGEEVWHDGEYFLDLMLRECQDFISHSGQQPFYLYWAINMPHYPLQPSAKWRKAYAELPSPRNKYAAFVSTVDEYVGKLIRTLDKSDLRRRTIIVFQSDHGHSTEERTFHGGGYAGPYRGAKGCLFEGGIRVPSIVSRPGTIPSGEVRKQMVTGCDWLPTIAEMCGAKLPECHLDGKSIVPVLMSDDAATPHEEFYWRLGTGKNAQWAVRAGEWKLLGNPRDTSGQGELTPQHNPFLVDLSQDVSEMKNLAAEHPDVVSRLRQIRDQFEAGIAESR